MLLYSDGIIERPGRPLAASTAEFADIASRVLGGSAFPIETTSRPVERLCSQTLELMLRTTGYNDDVTLLAAQRRTPPPPFELTVAATVQAAYEVRGPLRAWLSDIGADEVDVMIIVQSCASSSRTPSSTGTAQRPPTISTSRQRWTPTAWSMPR